jgi:hypothetical protein
MFGTKPNINQSNDYGKEEKNADVIKLFQQRELQAL